MQNRLGFALLGCAFLALCQPAQGAAIYDVSLDTTSLIGHPAGPFYVQMVFIDGSGVDDNNNTVTISNVDFGGGSVLGGGTTFGGVSGSMSTSVTMNDNTFLSLFVQQFAPGLHLNFTLSLTGSDDAGGTPDRFTFYLLDSSGVTLPTLAPFGDYFFGADLGSGGPVFDVWSSDPLRSPTVGDAVSVGAPVITSAEQIPEPSTIVLLGSALLGIGILRRKSPIARRWSGSGGG